MGEVGAASSVTRRVSGSDDMFVSVSVKWPFEATDDAAFEAAKEKVTAWCDTWLTERIEGLPDAGDLEGEEEVAEEAEEETTEEDTTEDAAEDELTPEMVQEMKPAELAVIIKDYGLDIDPKKFKLGALRDQVVEQLFTAEEEGEAVEEDGEEDGEEAEGEEADGTEESVEPYTKEELDKMQLKDLQEITNAWDLKVPVKKEADLKTKKAAYVKAILAAQET